MDSCEFVFFSCNGLRVFWEPRWSFSGYGPCEFVFLRVKDLRVFLGAHRWSFSGYGPCEGPGEFFWEPTDGLFRAMDSL